MEGLLKNGTKLVSESGTSYKIINLLGAGGQGEVYEVDANGKRMALKWYFKKSATPAQKKTIETLIAKGAPDNTFLWPLDFVNSKDKDTFGYIMPLRPKNFKSIVDLMKKKADPSFYNIVKTAYNLTKGYQKLHGMGASYRDISFGNLFFNPDTGDVLICDNDNVSFDSNEKGGVLGTPRFMAPEIVMGKARPSRNTDQYSLAVLLFFLFVVNHPLDGKKEANIKCMDINAMNLLYGKEPVFIFDPNNTSNRPVKGYQDNALIYWPLLPEKMKQLFIKSFTDGLTHPNKRVTENQWLDALSNMMGGIIECNCGAEVFYDEDLEAKNTAQICWNCQKTLRVPAKIVVDNKRRLLLNANAKLKSHHAYGDYDMETVVGTLVQNPNNPNLWGIRNQDKINWTYEKADGTQIPVEKGRSAGIAAGAKIHFTNSIGEFK